MKIKSNINKIVKVKLTEEAKQFWKQQHNISGIKNTEHELTDQKIEEKKDKDGYHSFQLHEIMNIFGPMAIMGCDSPFINNDILFDHDEVDIIKE